MRPACSLKRIQFCAISIHQRVALELSKIHGTPTILATNENEKFFLDTCNNFLQAREISTRIHQDSILFRQSIWPTDLAVTCSYFSFFQGMGLMFHPSSVLLSPACWTGKHTNQRRSGNPTGNQASRSPSRTSYFRLILPRSSDSAAAKREFSEQKVSVVRHLNRFGLPGGVLKFSWLDAVYGTAAPLRLYEPRPTSYSVLFEYNV
jgi:hypothetical protein